MSMLGYISPVTYIPFLQEKFRKHREAGRHPRGVSSGLHLNLLNIVDYRNLRDRPAIIGAGNLELHHRDGIGGTAHNTQSAANTLLFVDNHISAAAPALSNLVHRVAFHDARESFHAD